MAFFTTSPLNELPEQKIFLYWQNCHNFFGKTESAEFAEKLITYFFLLLFGLKKLKNIILLVEKRSTFPQKYFSHAELSYFLVFFAILFALIYVYMEILLQMENDVQ